MVVGPPHEQFHRLAVRADCAFYTQPPPSIYKSSCPLIVSVCGSGRGVDFWSGAHSPYLPRVAGLGSKLPINLASLSASES